VGVHSGEATLEGSVVVYFHITQQLFPLVFTQRSSNRMST
jgi:hypothetical protein